MSKHSLTTAEEKLLMAGFDYATDLNGFDPSWDDSDVLGVLETHPNLTAVPISLKINIPVHRVIAALARLKTSGKFKPPVATKEKVIDFQEGLEKPIDKDCSRGINEASVKIGMLVKCLDSEGVYKVDSFKDGHAKIDLIEGVKTLPKRRRVALHLLRKIDDSVAEPCSTGNDKPPKRSDFDSLVGFVVAYRQWENENPDQVDPDQLVPGTKVKLNDGSIAEVVDPINPPGCFVNVISQGKQLQVADGEYVVLGETVQIEQLNICEQSQNILLTEPPRQVEANSQLSIFFDSSEEPPDPDDYETGDEYEEAYDQWAVKFPELNAAINRKKSQEIKNRACEVRDYIQLKSDPRRIGQIVALKSGGIYKIKFADGFECDLKPDQYNEIPFSKDISNLEKGYSPTILGESFFKVGEFVVTSAPGFEDKIFKVEKIYHTGMIGVIDKSNQSFSFPANWLNHYVEKVGKSNKGKILENSERKRPAKGCGSGSLVVRQANKKRNAAKGRDPDIYYVYCYSYTDNYGKEIKSSISVPREKIAHVKGMIERKEHYVKIAKFLGKSLPCYY